MTDHKDPLVSVVITTYNYAQYLPTAVESVLNQTYKNLEIIIVNDGSTDNTDEVIAPYLKEKRIKYIKQKNAGQASAKNCGIKNSTGEIIAFLDADDFWRKDKLEKQMPLFLKDPAIGVVYADLNFIGSDGEALDIERPPRFRGDILQELFLDNFIGFSTTVVKKECFDKAGTFDENLPMAIDWHLWLRIACHYQFNYVDEPLLFYRCGHANMSRNTEKRFKCSDWVMEWFLKTHGEMLEKKTVEKAFTLTYNRRGRYYLNSDFMTGLHYLFKSIVVNPFQIAPVKILITRFLKPARHSND